MIGYHFQTTVDGWPAAVAKLPARTPVKAVNRPDILREAKGHNPGVVTVLRHWYDAGQTFDGAAYPVLLDRARQFFAAFLDDTFAQQYAAYVDVVETWNETIANSQTPEEQQWRVDQERAMCEVFEAEYRTRWPHMRLCLANTAIGNDIPIGYAKLAQQYGHYLGYHPYIATTDGAAIADDWQWYSGRFAAMDAAYRAQGVTVNWLFTEGGPVRVFPGGGLDPQGGWRMDGVCNGDANVYVAMMDAWAARVQAWNTANNGRARGVTLFTSTWDGDDVWVWFQTKQPEMGLLADVAARYPLPAIGEPPPPGPPPEPPPPPPPEPPPGNGDNLLPNWSFEEGHYNKNGVPELQIANAWDVAYHEGDDHPNYPGVTFVRPECRVLPASQLPPEERPLFIRDGEHTVKVFKGGMPVLFRYFTQPFNLDAGRYRVILPFFSDAVMAYTGGQKVFADDPMACRYQVVVNGAPVTPIVSPFPFGRWHEPAVEFDHPGGAASVGLRVSFIFGLKNNGIFMDAARLEPVDTPEPPPPPSPPPGEWNKVVYLMPQDTTPAEYDAVQAVAYPTRSEIAFSANSAFSRPGDVGTHKVIVYAVERWGGKTALEQWVQQQGYTYNPATVIEYRSMPPVNPSFALVSDISQHQGEVNFSTMKAKGVAAVIMRGPMGKAGMDQRMEQYHQQAGAAGLPRGMYALWRPEWNAEEQAQHAANVYLSRDWELPPAGDFEIPAPDGRNLAAEIHAYLLAFESITGVRMRIYTSASWWNANVGTTPWAAGYALWTAGYPNPQHTMHEPEEYWPGYTPKGWPVDDWHMWQFTTIEPGGDWGVQSARLDLNWEKI